MKKILSVMAIAILCVSSMNLFGFENAKAEGVDFPLQSTDEPIQNAISFLQDQQSTKGDIAGYDTSAWAVMALAAAEQNMADWDDLKDYLKEKSSSVDDSKATAWQKHLLAVTAAGIDPRDCDGIDCVQKVLSFFDGTQFGETNNLYDDFFGVLSLKTAGMNSSSSAIQSTVSYIIDNQQEDGSWGDVDATAAAVMALRSSGMQSSSEVIEQSLSFFKTMQAENGGFSSWGSTNAASTAWAVMALCMCGQDPTDEQWQKQSNPVEYLLSLQQPDGSFLWSVDQSMNEEWMTSYVVTALLGKYYPVVMLEEESLTGPSQDESEHSNQAVESWTGRIRIEGNHSTVWDGQLTVSDTTFSALNTSSSEIEEFHIAFPSVLGALIEASSLGGFDYSISYYESWDAFIVTEIAGESDWWHYYVDYSLPMVGANAYALDDSDQHILWGYLESWYVHALQLVVGVDEVLENEQFVVSVCNESMAPVQDVQIHIGSSVFVTDETGSVVVEINQPGSYEISADKEGYVRSEKLPLLVKEVIKFAQPSEGVLYLWGHPLAVSLGTTFIVGSTQVEVITADEVGRVDFYLDDVLIGNDSAAPFECSLNKFSLFGKHSLSAKAYFDDSMCSAVFQQMRYLQQLNCDMSSCHALELFDVYADVMNTVVSEPISKAQMQVRILNLLPMFHR